MLAVFWIRSPIYCVENHG